MNRRFSYSVPISCALLMLATLVVYSGVRNNSFIDFDDGVYVTQNQYVQQGLTWKTFLWSLTSAHRSGNWHPITWLSHALDWQVYGSNPFGHHLTSVLFHALNVLLLFFLLARATGATWRSFLVAMLFAVHPMNVESVAWVAERKNVLSTLFFLLALCAYGLYAVKPGVKRYIAIVVFFVLALASKPMAITLPFVLLLLDFWPLQRIQGGDYPKPHKKEKISSKERPKLSPIGSRFPVSQVPFRRLVHEKLPLLALCAACAIITVIAQRSTGSIETTTRIPFGMRLENAVTSYSLYIVKTFWPSRLAVYYPYPYRGITVWQVSLGALLLLTISGLTWSQRRKRPYLVTGWLWYLGTLVPVIGLVQVGNQAMADRYGYLPLVGIFVMSIWTLSDLADRKNVNLQIRGLTAAILLALLSFLTWRQVEYWQSDYALWGHAVKVTKNNVLAEANLARALRLLGRQQDALPHYEQAAMLSPQDPVRHLNLAVDLAECGQLQDAVTEYTTALQFISDHATKAQTYESLAALNAALENYSMVRDNYARALETDPQQFGAMIRHLSASIATDPTGQTYLQLGLLQEQAGHRDEAYLDYRQALKLDPGLEEARRSLNGLGRDERSSGH